MKKSLYLLAALLFLLSSSVSAGTAVEELSYNELVNKVEASLAQVEDFSAEVRIELIENERQNVTRLQVKASQVNEIARLEFYEPSVLAGQIIVADTQESQVSIFMPIIQQIIISPLEVVGADLGLGIDFTDLSGIFDFSSLSGTILEVENSDSGLNYCVELNAFDQQQTQYVWIGEDFMPYKITIYDNQNYLGSLELENLVTNQELTKQELVSLPNVIQVKL